MSDPKKELEALDKAAKEFADLQDDEQVRELRRLQQEIEKLRRENSTLQAKYRQAEEDLMKSEKQLETVLGLQDEKTRRKLTAAKKKPHGAATAIICLNDWHAEENVDPLTVDGANEFNPDICKSRLDRTFKKVPYLLEFARSISSIRRLVLWAGGDLVNGIIHEEAEESNFMGQTDAVLFIEEQLGTGIDFFLKECDIDALEFIGSFGNHGRSTRRRRVSTGWRHNWEWLSYQHIARQYRDEPKFQSKLGKGYHSWAEVSGRLIRFHHGDAIRYYGGIGGVSIPLRKKIGQWNKRRKAELDVIGHFHQYEDSWDYLLCGCLVGYNAYAQDIGAEPQDPTQTFLVIDEEYGKVLAMPIFCEDAKK